MREALLPGRPLALTTVLTVLGNLREKRAIRQVPSVGRAMKFRAVVPRERVAARSIKDIVSRYFQNSTASLMAHLVREGDLDESEMKEIRRMLDKAKKGEEK